MTLLLSTNIENFKFINFANQSHHWSKKKRIKETLYFEFYYPNTIPLKRIELPVVVKIIRIAPKPFDQDNYIYNCKCIRDFISWIFFPDKAYGHGDSSKDITWQYCQEKGKPKQHALKIQIWK